MAEPGTSITLASSTLPYIFLWLHLGRCHPSLSLEWNRLSSIPQCIVILLCCCHPSYNNGLIAAAGTVPGILTAKSLSQADMA
jgi:hypothetical protein